MKKIKLIFEDDMLNPQEFFQLLHDLLMLPGQIQQIKELLMENMEQFQAAMDNLKSTVDAGFQTLSDHVAAETALVLDALAAAGSGVAIASATAAVQAFADSLQAKFQAVQDQIDAELPAPPAP